MLADEWANAFDC